MRSCVACRTPRPKRELVRVVRRPDGSMGVDPTGRQPGRGAYLCRDTACFDLAGRRRALAHALGGPIPAALEVLLAAGPPEVTEIPSERPRPEGTRPPALHTTITGGGTHGQE